MKQLFEGELTGNHLPKVTNLLQFLIDTSHSPTLAFPESVISVLTNLKAVPPPEESANSSTGRDS